MRRLLVVGIFLNAALLAVRAVQESRHEVEAQTLPNEIIIDNGKPGTSFRGVWTKSSAPNPFGTESIYNSSAGNWYSWRADVDPGSAYDVYAWWTSLASRNNSAIYQFGGTSRGVDQRTNGGKWNLLARVGPGLSVLDVTLRTDAGFSHSADAVRFVRVPPPPGPVFTQANADVLAHFTRIPNVPWRKQFEDETAEDAGTPVIRISGATLQITGETNEPGCLMVGNDEVLIPGDDWQNGGARFSALVEAPFFRGPQGE